MIWLKNKSIVFYFSFSLKSIIQLFRKLPIATGKLCPGVLSQPPQFPMTAMLHTPDESCFFCILTQPNQNHYSPLRIGCMKSAVHQGHLPSRNENQFPLERRNSITFIVTNQITFRYIYESGSSRFVWQCT
jgi:hypothetical protein